MTTKKFIFIFFPLIIFFLIFEFIFYTYFKIEDFQDLENYINKRKGVNSYEYFDNLNLVLPKPNAKIIFYTQEYTDKANTKDIFNKGFGLFDDENKLRSKYQMLALGDSFTFGAGAIDPINKNIFSLIEKKDEDFNIINLGNLGKSIHDQKYIYNKLKNFSNHDYLIYNFFSGGDYRDNLSDFTPSYYIEKITKNLSQNDRKKLINDFNKIHGFKYHLEYLMNKKIKSYNYYFLLKIYDLVLIKLAEKSISFLEYGKNLFKKYPLEMGRLGEVDKDTYKLKQDHNKSIMICEKKYCFQHHKVFENKDLTNKIIENSANLINKFHVETKNENKTFILVIHPSARNLYSKDVTIVDYNSIDIKLLEKINKDILVIDLRKYLINYQRQNPLDVLFWKVDGHYTPKGYEISQEFVYNSLIDIIKKVN